MRLPKTNFKKVRITKVGGTINSSIKTKYWVEGTQVHDVEKGRTYKIVCPIKTSCPSENVSWFHTTEVTNAVAVGEAIFMTTINSVWKLERAESS